jgi:uncharacterized protein with GYD domain
MPKYLWEVSYTEEGARALLKEGGSKRRTAVEETVKSLGGKLEAFYYAFGKHDLYGIAELPDSETVAAFSLAVKAAGGASVRTTVLMTPEQLDAATKKTVSYRPPGK